MSSIIIQGVDLVEATETKQCELLGSFALYVQGALGALALLSLVYKRYRERPQRPVKIWFFDASKQVVGSILVHIANLLLAYLSSRPQKRPDDDDSEPSPDDSPYQPNPCSFYLLNLLIDTTIGIFILVFFLRVTTALCKMLPSNYAFSHGIDSGNYGRPPKTKNWLKQSAIYFVGLMGMKTVVWIMFETMPWLGRFGDWLLGWTEGNRKVQIAFVMFIFPLVMNAMQYYIIDTFIKMKEGSSPYLSDEDVSGDEEDLSGSEILDRDGNIPQVQPSAAAGNVDLYSDDDDEDRGLLDPSKKKKQSRKRSKSPSLRPAKHTEVSTDGDSIVGSAEEDLEQGNAYKLKKHKDDQE